MYPQRLGFLDSEAWAACGDGGVLRRSVGGWTSEAAVNYAGDLSVTRSKVHYAASNALLMHDRATGRVKTILRRPDVAAVATTADGSGATASGDTVYVLGSESQTVMKKDLPFAPRRLARFGEFVYAAGAGGALRIKVS